VTDAWRLVRALRENPTNCDIRQRQSLFWCSPKNAEFRSARRRQIATAAKDLCNGLCGATLTRFIRPSASGVCFARPAVSSASVIAPTILYGGTAPALSLGITQFNRAGGDGGTNVHRALVLHIGPDRIRHERRHLANLHRTLTSTGRFHTQMRGRPGTALVYQGARLRNGSPSG